MIFAPSHRQVITMAKDAELDCLKVAQERAFQNMKSAFDTHPRLTIVVTVQVQLATQPMATATRRNRRVTWPSVVSWSKRFERLVPSTKHLSLPSGEPKMTSTRANAHSMPLSQNTSAQAPSSSVPRRSSIRVPKPSSRDWKGSRPRAASVAKTRSRSLPEPVSRTGTMTTCGFRPIPTATPTSTSVELVSQTDPATATTSWIAAAR